MAKRRKTRKRSTKRTIKKKLAGFTKTKGKFALVFKKGRKLSVGKGRYTKKSSLISAAKKFVK